MEAPGHLEPVRVHFDQQFIHHAHRIMSRAVGGEPGPVRHRAGRDLRDLDHRAHVDHRHRTRLVLAVQVEVRREEQARRRHLHGGREEAEFGAPRGAVRGRGIGDDHAEGVAVRERDVPALAIGVDREPVRPVDLRRKPSHEDGIHQRRTGLVEPDEIDSILRFGRHVDVIGRAVGTTVLASRALNRRGRAKQHPHGGRPAESCELRLVHTRYVRSLFLRCNRTPCRGFGRSQPYILSTLRVDNWLDRGQLGSGSRPSAGASAGPEQGARLPPGGGRRGRGRVHVTPFEESPGSTGHGAG